ncbi:hypothetical protein IF1G_06384 [Cordyceps javanica]|uniref:Uncharacterized protein n=1 Tax=Cordyceps javanica TaxID=43265 RepID=A0A545V131_9HYPO|nr:hypothetical protein IF1G_06384 [Cordyceps javanica]
MVAWRAFDDNAEVIEPVLPVQTCAKIVIMGLGASAARFGKRHCGEQADRDLRQGAALRCTANQLNERVGFKCKNSQSWSFFSTTKCEFRNGYSDCRAVISMIKEHHDSHGRNGGQEISMLNYRCVLSIAQPDQEKQKHASSVQQVCSKNLIIGWQGAASAAWLNESRSLQGKSRGIPCQPRLALYGVFSPALPQRSIIAMLASDYSTAIGYDQYGGRERDKYIKPVVAARFSSAFRGNHQALPFNS